jgi:hypothetical protein
VSTSELRELLSKVGVLPISPSWMYMSIRHCQRNMDFEEYQDDDLNVPDRQSGDSIAKLINAVPALLDELDALRAAQEPQS